MRASLMPMPGQIFEMNDLISRMWGFEPFFLSTTAMTCEHMRRGFVLAAKELLFQEKEVKTRTKFIMCYVLARGAEAARAAAQSGTPLGEREGSRVTSMLARARSRSMASTMSSATATVIGNGSDYDPLAIMSAHAAFLACQHGATPAGLRLAADASRVRALCDSFPDPDADGHKSVSAGESNSNLSEEDTVLGRQDAAAALFAHSMAGRPARVDAALLRTFVVAFGSAIKRNKQGGRICHRSLLEVVGAACIWSAMERFAVAALAFDIDMTSTLMFGTGRAEPAIMDFAQSTVGKDVRLSLVTDEVAEARARRDSKVGRMSSLLSGYGGSSRSPYQRKRSSSALATAPSRVVRMLLRLTLSACTELAQSRARPPPCRHATHPERRTALATAMTVAFVAHAALPLTKTTRVATCVRMGPKRADGSEVPAARPRGLFGKLRDAVLRPIVSVPGSEGRGDLLDCVFCKSTGRNDCEGCAGCGTDALGKCLMCDGRYVHPFFFLVLAAAACADRRVLSRGAAAACLRARCARASASSIACAAAARTTATSTSCASRRAKSRRR
eukprot:IDg14230t1